MNRMRSDVKCQMFIFFLLSSVDLYNLQKMSFIAIVSYFHRGFYLLDKRHFQINGNFSWNLSKNKNVDEAHQCTLLNRLSRKLPVREYEEDCD